MGDVISARPETMPGMPAARTVKMTPRTSLTRLGAAERKPMEDDTTSTKLVALPCSNDKTHGDEVQLEQVGEDPTTGQDLSCERPWVDAGPRR